MFQRLRRKPAASTKLMSPRPCHCKNERLVELAMSSPEVGAECVGRGASQISQFDTKGWLWKVHPAHSQWLWPSTGSRTVVAAICSCELRLARKVSVSTINKLSCFAFIKRSWFCRACTSSAERPFTMSSQDLGSKSGSRFPVLFAEL